jgi:hypothetical protein
MSYPVLPELKNMKLKRIWKSNGMKSIIPSAMNQTLICDIETNYFPNLTAENLSYRYLLAASKILWSENLGIKLNSDCDFNN